MWEEQLGKRFTETSKWNKPWFRKLTPVEKSAWFYITENCDNVGVWDADKELAEFCIGGPVDWDTFIEKTNGNIEILDDGKWWLVDFCEFQHTDLDPSSQSKPVQSYIRLLKRHNLYQRVMKAFGYSLDTFSKGSKERERVRDKEREKDMEEEEENREETFIERFEEFWELYPRKVAKAKAWDKWQKLKPDETLFGEIMAGLRKYVESKQWHNDNGRYVPYPITFLNQERWKDEIDVEQERNSPFE
jgi:hypothetical protein